MRRIIKAPLRRDPEPDRSRAAPHPFSGLTAGQFQELRIGIAGAFRDPAARSAAYRVYRDELIESMRLGHRPATFWEFEPGLPANVRGPGDEQGEELDEWMGGHRPALAAAMALKERRARWLLRSGDLRPGEFDALAARITRYGIGDYIGASGQEPIRAKSRQG
jgi:hypothetical protein